MTKQKIREILSSGGLSLLFTPKRQSTTEGGDASWTGQINAKKPTAACSPAPSPMGDGAGCASDAFKSGYHQAALDIARLGMEGLVLESKLADERMEHQEMQALAGKLAEEYRNRVVSEWRTAGGRFTNRPFDPPTDEQIHLQAPALARYNDAVARHGGGGGAL